VLALGCVAALPQAVQAAFQGAATCGSPFPILCDVTSENFLRNGAGPLLTRGIRPAFSPIDSVPGFNPGGAADTRSGAFNASAASSILLASKPGLSPGQFVALRALDVLRPTRAGLAQALLAAGDAAGAQAILAGTLNSQASILIRNLGLGFSFPPFTSLRLPDLVLGLPPLHLLPLAPADRINEFTGSLARNAQSASGTLQNAIPFFTGPDGIQNTTDDLPIGPGPDGIAGFDVLGTGLSERDCAVLRSGGDGGINTLGECVRIQAIQSPVLTNGVLVAGITDDDRPPDASLEPADLTGIGSGPLPARPRSPNGGLLFPPELDPTPRVHSRRVDPETGAPVRSSGPLLCGTGSGGPNGIVGDGDDEVPFLGNCLLFNDDGSRRAPSEVAFDNPGDQTLLHTICTGTNSGGCLLDFPNNTGLLEPIAWVLGGSLISQVAVAGFDTIRPQSSRFSPLDSSAIATVMFAGVNPERSIGALDVDRQALLGCGARFASGCDAAQAQGGVDFGNMDGSLFTQEWALLRAFTPGALVGHRGSGVQSYFESGVTRPEAVHLGGVATPFSPEVALQVEAQGQSATAFALLNAAAPITKTDFQIEPFKFAPDPDLLAMGIVRFDPSHPVPGGESCSQVLGIPDSTCTELEIISANFERLEITNEIIGSDDVFDPPETLDELMAILDGDPTNDATGDPISGPDGIVFHNVDSDCDGRADRKGLRVNLNLGQITVDQVVTDAANCPASVCYLDITAALISCGEIDPGDVSATIRMLDALPIRVQATLAVGGPIPVDPHTLTAVELQRLLDRETIGIDTDSDLVPDTEIKFNGPTRKLFTAFAQGRGSTQDLDGDGVHDLDEDRNGMVDWADDGTSGPVTDDNVGCGSGIPGDPLQEALQIEFVDRADLTALGGLFPNGFPPRTPTLCFDLLSLLAMTGESAPGRRDFLWHLSHNDGDPWMHASDNCPTVKNTFQGDTDGDGLGSACDNCRNRPNAEPIPAGHRGTGRQTDDDLDGVGNVCDADFDQSGFVNLTDLLMLLDAFGQPTSASSCLDEGGFPTGPCARYDLTVEGSVIDVDDLMLAIGEGLFGKPIFDQTCEVDDDGTLQCPLECEAGLGPVCP
jgi:hypothetical protein